MNQSSALTVDLALQLVRSTLEIAAAETTGVAVVVVDSGGRVVSGARADGVGWVNWEVATRKAVAAATLGAPTHAVRAMASEDPVLAAAVDGVEQVLVVPGGFPVRAGDATVGGIGIAGGHYTQDQQIGEKALAAAASS
ncbi:GlcG/HbpS family heme-binding protein [Pseudonocardia asaccharolytica]|nr:heme-binding protein [Pseudonocardia asaccharolytica]